MDVAYVRVSTKEQDEDIQRQEIIGFAQKVGANIEKFLVDKGESGSKAFLERPAAIELNSLMNSGQVSRIFVSAIDRLGRDMMDTLNTIQNYESKGVMIMSAKEEWMQTTDPNFRKLILAIFSWIAEFEKRRMRERQEAAWAAGKTKGRPKKEIPMEEIKRRLQAGWTIRSIWRWLKLDKGIDVSYSLLTMRIKEL